MRESVGAERCDEVGHEWNDSGLDCDRCGLPRECEAATCPALATGYDDEDGEYLCAHHLAAYRAARGEA